MQSIEERRGLRQDLTTDCCKDQVPRREKMGKSKKMSAITRSNELNPAV